MPTIKEVIIELMPFSEELVIWCKTHPDFLNALKNVHPEKFISPAMIITSYPASGDEVIGVYTYHHELNSPIFKQDFIVNTGRLNKEFVLYTRNPAGSSKYVKDIKDFFAKYSKYGYTKSSHHLALKELPVELQERATETIRLAEKVKNTDISEIPQSHINRIYREVVAIKRENRYIKQKLDKKIRL